MHAGYSGEDSGAIGAAGTSIWEGLGGPHDSVKTGHLLFQPSFDYGMSKK